MLRLVAMKHSTALLLLFGLFSFGNESSIVTDSPLLALVALELVFVLAFVLLTAWMRMPPGPATRR